MREYGTIYKTKHLKILGISVARITASYEMFEGGIRGTIVIFNENKSIVLSQIAIPDGNVSQIKVMLDKPFDSIKLW